MKGVDTTQVYCDSVFHDCVKFDSGDAVKVSTKITAAMMDVDLLPLQLRQPSENLVEVFIEAINEAPSSVYCLKRPVVASSVWPDVCFFLFTRYV